LIAEKAAHGVRRLRTLLEPVQDPIFLQLDASRLLNRIIPSQVFNVPAIPRKSGIGGDHGVYRVFFAPHSA
jgi:hypothetical protein